MPKTVFIPEIGRRVDAETVFMPSSRETTEFLASQRPALLEAERAAPMIVDLLRAYADELAESGVPVTVETRCDAQAVYGLFKTPTAEAEVTVSKSFAARSDPDEFARVLRQNQLEPLVERLA